MNNDEKNVRKRLPTLPLQAVFSLLFIVFFTLSNADEMKTSSSLNTPRSSNITVSEEPIQPLYLATNLDPRIVSLGKRLFNEQRLSRDNNLACSHCHFMDENGADHVKYNVGRNGVKLAVNTLTVFNSSLNHRFFWDGRANSLEDQINFVVKSANEFATTWPEIIAKLASDKQYQYDFQQLYPDGITADNIRNAIATFERTLITPNSRFDQYLLGDTNAITQEEKKGYRLFKNYGCVACHQGRNVGGNLFMKFGVFKDYFTARGNPTTADLGRYNVTGKKQDRYVFRVPSLRLAVLTAPYFHDGSVKTLEKAVELMGIHQLGRKIPEENIDLIVAFLKTLPGEYNGRPLSSATAKAMKQERNTAP